MSYEINYIFYDDGDYSNVANYCNNNNLAIVEIERDENGRRRFQIQEPSSNFPYNEIDELRHWFDVYYAQHEQKYRRMIALNKKTDEGEDAEEVLYRLYEEAEVKRARIKELEKEAEGE